MPPQRSGSRTKRGAIILLVEDDAPSFQPMKDVLEASGYEVSQAINGPDGLTVACAQSPDLIVIDIGLPGMDGVEVTRTLKRT